MSKFYIMVWMLCRGIAARLGQPGAELELVIALQGADLNSSISTFEFLTSGVVTRLRAYLQGLPRARCACLAWRACIDGCHLYCFFLTANSDVG